MGNIFVYLKKVLGIFFILIGILGLFLPILQGILLIAIGLFLFDEKRFEKYYKNIIKKFKKKN